MHQPTPTHQFISSGHRHLYLMHLLASMLLCSATLAQVNFFDYSFNQALKKARKENKVVMLVMEAATCAECNAVSNLALTDPEAFALNSLTIPLRLSPANELWQILATQHYPNKNAAMGLLFFNGVGELVHLYPSTSSSAQVYVAQATTALRKQHTPLPTAASYEAILQQHPTDTAAMRQLIFAQRQIGKDAQPWIDAYARTLPKDEATLQASLIAIARLAPVLGSYADSVLRQNPSFNQAWYSMPLPLRISINKQIVMLSTQKAIDTRNQHLAARSASFAMSVNESRNPDQNRFMHAQHMAIYYRAVYDTAQYLHYARMAIIHGLLKLPADSIVAIDQQRMRSLPLNTNEPMAPVREVRYSYSPMGQQMAIECNKYAWDIYNMSAKTTDINLALQVAEQGLRLYPLPALYDTYARLLYISGEKEKAMEQQRKAIAYQLKRNIPAMEFEKILREMETGTFKK